MAHVSVLFPGLAATLLSDRSAADAGAKQRRIARNQRSCRCNIMNEEVGAIDLNCPGREANQARMAVPLNRRYLKCFCAIGLTILSSCTTVSRHQFDQPAENWQSRSGQLLYRSSTATLIGEVFVRFSNDNNFELTFSKGPGIT